MPKRKTQIRIIVSLGAASFIAVLLYSSLQQTKNEYEVCVTFKGAIHCATASGATSQEAIRSAQGIDCELLANVSNFGVNTNGGTAVSKGLEGEIAWALTHEFTLSANGALTDAYLTEDTPALTGGHNGDRLPYSSPVAGSVSGDYRHALSDDTQLFAGASVCPTGWTHLRRVY